MHPTLPSNVNLELTLFGGQSFVSSKEENGFKISLTQGVINIIKNRITIEGRITPQKASSFLGLHFDYEAIRSRLVKIEPRLEPIIAYTGTILLLKQEFLPTLLSFIISANNSIKRIRASVQKLIKKYGSKTKSYYTFPSYKVLERLNEDDWKELGVGYRASFLVETLHRLKTEKIYRTLRNMSQEQLYQEGFSLLQQLKGIGPKVADCVLTFSLGLTLTTPIDLWARRYLAYFFNLPKNKSYGYYRDFLTDRFGELTAFAGQYLFEYFRTLKIKDKTSL